MLYDITRTITPQTAVWPGDANFRFEHALDMRNGSSVNLTTVTLSPHTGSHADAYYHYTPDGAHPAQMPLDAYLGAARVIHVERRDGALVPAELGEIPAGTERILIRSHVSDLPDDVFPQEFPYLSAALIAWLATLGVKLIGLDSPSVDAFDSKALPSHNALRQHGIVNLELLQLRDVPAGDYELIALPLKLDGVCGSPVRAVLRSR